MFVYPKNSHKISKQNSYKVPTPFSLSYRCSHGSVVVGTVTSELSKHCSRWRRVL